MYLIAACLLTFRPLFSKLPLKWLTSHLSGTSSSSRNLPAHTSAGGGAENSGPALQLTNLRPNSRSHAGFAELHDPPSPITPPGSGSHVARTDPEQGYIEMPKTSGIGFAT